MYSRRLRRLLPAVLVPLVLALGLSGSATAVSSDIVISQVYGGGGNAGAELRNDFIELFNRGNAPVDVSGWSVQYAATTGTSWQRTNLTGSIPAGGYYLVQQAAGANMLATPLPTPDATGTIPMSATAGKVVLVSNQTLITSGTSCPSAAVIDLIGYGSATNCFEGTPTANLSNTTAALRGSNGCTDTDNNSADFSIGAPSPRNTASPLDPCTVTPSLTINDVSANEGNAGTTTFTFTVSLSTPAGAGGVTFDIATADNTATVADSDYVVASLTGQTIPAGNSSYSFSVTVNGDTAEEADETFFVNVTNVIGATLGDGQGQGTIVNDDTDFCALPYTPIYQIQGSGPSAAITGNVSTQGVVVGDFEGPIASGLQGFYLQDSTGDGNAATSDGIFVFTGDNASVVSPGDVVRVTGFARERFNQTALNGSNSNTSPVTNIVNCGTGSVAPTDVMMPFASTTAPERFEGMLVRFPQSLVISEYFDYERFGEIVLGLPLDGEDRHFTPTSVVEPGAAANARTAAYNLRRITLDDGLGSQNPPEVRHPNGASFSLVNRFRGGDTVQNTVGVMGFDFSRYRIQPTGPADYTALNDRPGPVEAPEGIRVAAMNTLNYFLSPDNIQEATGQPDNPADNICGPIPSLECRGWDGGQLDELSRQRTKLLAALAGLESDVVGLNELENTTGVEPLADIVSGLNDTLGAGTYAYIDTGTIGTDAIKVGLIYKPGVVTPVGEYEILTSAVDPRFIDTLNRPVLAQTFQVNATGARFTVAVNHLKSKGSACSGDPDLGDGQGNCNQTRKLAAQALVDWLASDPTGSGDPDFLIVGDLNSYAKEDPIDAVLAGPDDVLGTADDYTNLIEQFEGDYAYSFVFDGQAGYLDHGLASATLAAQVLGATEWHINADEPDLLDYDTSFKPPEQEAIFEPNQFRSADHDPLVVGLGACDDVDPTLSVTVAPNVLWPPNHRYVTVQADVEFDDNFDTSPTLELVSVTSNEPDNGEDDGNTVDDVVMVDQDTFKLRAERSGSGTGRVYTITYRVTDDCGNSTTESATVTVPLAK